MPPKLRRLIGSLILALLRLRYVDAGQITGRSGVITGAPHTSNWDLVITWGLVWRAGYRFKVLVKDKAFVGPLGTFIRACGGLPVNRENPQGLIEELVHELEHGEPFFLCIAPEGTRSLKSNWKSGFYRIARATDLPVTMGFADSATRTAGFGPTIELTGDVTADMDHFRAFYAGKRGIRPGLETPVRLREELTGETI